MVGLAGDYCGPPTDNHPHTISREGLRSFSTKHHYMTHSTLRRNRQRRPNKTMITEASGPRAATIQAILGYSRALRVVHAPPIGQVDIVLN